MGQIFFYPLLFLLTLFLGVPPSSAWAQKGAAAPEATTPTTDPLPLIDRALAEADKNPRLKEALLALRKESEALKQLIEQLRLRRDVAHKSREAFEQERQHLVATPLPDLVRDFRTRLRSDPDEAAQWLSAQEATLLESQARWRTEWEASQRPTSADPPALLAANAEAAFQVNHRAIASIQPLVRLYREQGQRLWHEVVAAEEAARKAQQQLAEAHLTRIEKLLAQLAKLRSPAPGADRWRDDPLWQQGQTLMQTLSEHRSAAEALIEQLQEAQRQLERRWQGLAERYERLSQRISSQGLTPLLSHQLAALAKEVTALKAESDEHLTQASEAISRWQQSEMALVQGVQRQTHLEEAIRTLIARLEPEAQTTAKSAFDPLLEGVRSELSRLTAQRQALIQAASELEATANGAQLFATQALTTMTGQLLWAQSAPPWWVAAATEIAAIGVALATLLAALPAFTLSPPHALWATLPLLLLILCGKSVKRWLSAFTTLLPQTAREEQHAARATLKLLAVAALLALPAPLTLLAVALPLSGAAHPYLTAAGSALLHTAFLWWNLLFWTTLLTRAGGLLCYRYRVPQEQLAALTFVLRGFVVIAAPLATLAAFLLALPAHEEASSAARTPLLGTALSLVVLIGWLLRPWGKVPFLNLSLSLRWFFWAVTLLPPAASALLLLFGYHHAGEAILVAYWRTLWVLLSLLLLLDLAQAAITARWHHLAQNREAENLAATPQDLAQLIRLARWGVAALATLLFWWLWSPLLPALRKLDEWILWRYQETVGNETLIFTVSVADLLFATVGLLLLVLLTRHAPLLLDFALAQTRRLDAGAKYAAVTLFRYLLVTVGLVWLLNQLGMPWSKLQWMVAALSVGLGFGLQEIVANFVSGLIILFERPIRVGDLVTIQGTTGIVKRITIRATVIETSDKQEVLIPNKAIITGNVTNWTLSDLQSRLVLAVGVAYGSDLVAVCQTLLDVAKNHPNVLKDPEPTLAFVQFGASSIDFELRCFVADVAIRNQTRTELALQIVHAFAQRGIEIPFPQQDLHLRTIAPEAAAALRGG